MSVLLKIYTFNERMFKPLDVECLRLDSDSSVDFLSYRQ